MLTLYYSQGSCADVALMLAKALEIDLNVVNVNIPKAQLEDGSDFTAINPKGYVPALELENGEVITELLAICAYLSQQKPGNALFPLSGKALIDQLQWFNFLATEIHKNIMPLFWRLFGKDTGEKWPEIAKENLQKYYAFINDALEHQHYLTGEAITAADFYLYMTTLWADKVGVDLSAFKHINAFKERAASQLS